MGAKKFGQMLIKIQELTNISEGATIFSSVTTNIQMGATQFSEGWQTIFSKCFKSFIGYLQKG